MTSGSWRACASASTSCMQACSWRQARPSSCSARPVIRTRSACCSRCRGSTQHGAPGCIRSRARRGTCSAHRARARSSHAAASRSSCRARKYHRSWRSSVDTRSPALTPYRSMNGTGRARRQPHERRSPLARSRRGNRFCLFPCSSTERRPMSSGSDGTGPLVELEHLKVYFPIKSGLVLDRHVGDIRAVDDVSLTIRRGETVGLVGESGCGKSTVGRTILRLYKPTEGRIVFDGRDISTLNETELRPLRRRMQMVFQDPFASLNPRHSVGRIVGEPLRTHGISGRRETSSRVRELLEIVGLPADAAGRYPHEFSGGQRQRIGLARSLALNPDFIVCDEPVSALDVSIQAQIINLLEGLQSDFDLTYLFIAHDLAVVRHISDRIAVMYLGWIVEVSPAAELYESPLHPYTISLLSAVPIPDPKVERQRESILLAGDLPSPANPPPACRFHTRCPYVQPTRCRDETPELRELLPGHAVACHWAERIREGRIKPHEVEPVFDPGVPEPVPEPPPV